MKEIKFNPGQIVATPGVIDEVGELEFIKGLERHLSGDWGDLDEEDTKMNDRALRTGEDRMLSAYHSPNGTKYYIITEWDRSVTTILLPSEY